MGQQLALDLGYDHNRLASVSLNLEQIGFTKNNFESQLDQIVRQVERVPGVEQVTASCFQPLAGAMGLQNSESWVPEGYDSSNGKSLDYGVFRGMTPGVFKLMGLSVLRGREFSQEDIELGRKNILVNERFVHTFWPGQNPVGKQIWVWKVIGVVKDAHLDQFNAEPYAAVFLPTKKERLLHATLLLRTQGNTRDVIGAVRKTLAGIHPKLGQGDMGPLRDRIRSALAVQYSAMRILVTLGILALVLASVGTYGVIAYVVNSQTRDIAIRLAIGATSRDVKLLVLSMGLRLGLIALGIGIPLAFCASGLLRHQIAGINPFDPVSFITVVGCVLAALLAACWLPARRAARIDPMEALRYE